MVSSSLRFRLSASCSRVRASPVANRLTSRPRDSAPASRRSTTARVSRAYRSSDSASRCIAFTRGESSASLGDFAASLAAIFATLDAVLSCIARSSSRVASSLRSRSPARPSARSARAFQAWFAASRAATRESVSRTWLATSPRICDSDLSTESRSLSSSRVDDDDAFVPAAASRSTGDPPATSLRSSSASSKMDSSGDAGGEAFAFDDDGLLIRESLERGESAPGEAGARGSPAAPAPARGDIGGDGVTGGNVKPASPSMAGMASVGRAGSSRPRTTQTVTPSHAVPTGWSNSGTPHPLDGSREFINQARRCVRARVGNGGVRGAGGDIGARGVSRAPEATRRERAPRPRGGDRGSSGGGRRRIRQHHDRPTRPRRLGDVRRLLGDGDDAATSGGRRRDRAGARTRDPAILRGGSHRLGQELRRGRAQPRPRGVRLARPRLQLFLSQRMEGAAKQAEARRDRVGLRRARG